MLSFSFMAAYQFHTVATLSLQQFNLKDSDTTFMLNYFNTFLEQTDIYAMQIKLFAQSNNDICQYG